MSERLGVSAHSLYKWVKVVKPDKTDEQAAELIEVHSEVLKLRAQLKLTEEEREILEVDVRVIAATNQDLARAIKESRFREDLFHRLNVIRINTPPLRRRREDIPLLLNHYLAEAAQELAAAAKSIDPEAMDMLRSYDWPGNVRQLVNATRRLTVTAPGNVIGAQDVPAELGGDSLTERAAQDWTRSLTSWAEAN